MYASSHSEKLISGLGGFISIFAVYLITSLFETALQAQILFVASMGATAVLLFAAPHSPLSQPWNVTGGHVVSAFVGVLVHGLIADQILAGALAVGVAITAMYYLKCLHPPGGATALVAVIGGSSVDSFGFTYVYFPVGLSAVLMVLIAIAFNYPFPWRRYPTAITKAPPIHETVDDQPKHYPDITHADLVAALSEIDGYVDISEQDLLRIYEIATNRPHSSTRPSHKLAKKPFG